MHQIKLMSRHQPSCAALAVGGSSHSSHRGAGTPARELSRLNGGQQCPTFWLAQENRVTQEMAGPGERDQVGIAEFPDAGISLLEGHAVRLPSLDLASRPGTLCAMRRAATGVSISNCVSMKIALSLMLLSACVALGDTPTIPLTPNESVSDFDYGDQIVEKFNALLKSDDMLKAQFAEFESEPKERAGGKYMGASATAFVLRRSIDVDFRDDLEDGGKLNYRQMVVVYYSFEEGYRRGMHVTSGVFAIFDLIGQQTFKKKSVDELIDHTVSASFKGFQTTLNAESDGADQSAAGVESHAK
ncbi:MAG TPA: hypothetical protein VMN36_10890 [Verrucomicrobiales bacterium]|nr:hypothetical protein [Verrucomicrobiales bacterium]